MTTLPILLRLEPIDPARAPARQIELGAFGTYHAGREEGLALTFDDASVSRRHLSIDVLPDAVRVRDLGSTNGTLVDGERVSEADIGPGSRVELGGWRILWPAEAPEMDEDDGRVLSSIVSPEERPGTAGSPLMERLIAGAGAVDPDRLRREVPGLEEVRFCAVGGGLGSFVWVDHLRCYGIPASDIRVLGDEEVPYATYKRYCRNSQIPDHERLRSNSLSRPDNIWGFPGYAMREAGKGGGLKGIFQVFGEPTLAESYTPRAGDVFDSLDEEAARIDWRAMVRKARVTAMRKTTDGRYCVVYRSRGGDERDGSEGAVIADVVHLSTGYPATRFVDDLREFRAAHPAHAHRVVNAYDRHDEVYEAIERRSDPTYVVVRGRGIVASRVLQRLSEARAKNPKIEIIQAMRSPRGRGEGARWGRARRIVRNNVEMQPFNWPKSCWGGELHDVHEAAPEAERANMLRTLGGTTTAERSDWVAIPERGEEEGWYRPVYGSFQEIAPLEDGRIRISVATPKGHVEILNVDYLVDCTGLIADIEHVPDSLLGDLVGAYDLPRNYAYKGRGRGAVRSHPTGIAVSPEFEIETLRNGAGRVYAAGVVTAGGPYLPVDSFLGLQYSALRSVEAMAHARAHGLRPLRPLRSLLQWGRWMRGVSP